MSSSTATSQSGSSSFWSWLPWSTQKSNAQPPAPPRPAPAREGAEQPQTVDRTRRESPLVSGIRALAPETTQPAMTQPSERRIIDGAPAGAAIRGAAPAVPAVAENPVRVPPQVRIADFDAHRLVQSGTNGAPDLALETGRSMQALLNANGANLAVDGRLGPAFRQAMADFRKARGLGNGTGHGTGIDQGTMDALIAGSRTPHDRGRTFTGFENATERQKSAGNMLAVLSSQDPQRFAQLMQSAGVQLPKSGPFEVTPAIADKAIRAIENPANGGSGLPFSEKTRANLSYGSPQQPNGEWPLEAAMVAAGVGIHGAGGKYDAPVLNRGLDRDIYRSELLRRTAAMEGIPLHEAQALIAVESDGQWIGANQYGATGYTQVTPGLARGFRLIDNRMTYVGFNYNGPGQRVNVNNKEHNLRLGFAARLGFYHDEATRLLGLPHGAPRTDRAMSTVDAGYNAGIGRLRNYGGTPNFEETRNQIYRIRAYMDVFSRFNETHPTVPDAPVRAPAERRVAPPRPAPREHRRHGRH